MNDDQRRFTAYVMALEAGEVFKARTAVQRAEMELRRAQHALDAARLLLTMAEDNQRLMREHFEHGE